jgi:hypothetical protein
MSAKVIIFIDGSNFLGICREFDQSLQIDFDRLAYSGPSRPPIPVDAGHPFR